MRFPIEDIPQQNPLLTGVRQGNDLYDQILKSLFMKDALKNQQAMNALALKDAKTRSDYLPNQLSLGLEGQMSDNDYKTMRNKYYPQDVQSQIDMRTAQIQKLKQNQGYQVQSQIGKLLQDGEFYRTVFGEDSPQYKQFKQQADAEFKKMQTLTELQEAYKNSLGYRSAPDLIKEQISLGGQSAGQTPEQAQYRATYGGMGLVPGAQNGGGYGMGQIPQNQLAQTPQDQERSRQGADQLASRIVRQTTEPEDLKRIRAGNRAEVAGENIDQFINAGALEYNGLKGQSLLAKDKLMATMTGIVSPRLMAYQNMQGQMATWEDEYATTIGIPSDQKARGDFHKLFDIHSLSKNPQAAALQIQNIKSLLQKTGGVNRISLAQAVKNNEQIEKKYGSSEGGFTVNPNQLSAGALANPEIAKAAGISSADIPQFNSKDEFQKWYAKQAPEKQAMIRKMLGGQ